MMIRANCINDIPNSEFHQPYLLVLSIFGHFLIVNQIDKLKKDTNSYIPGEGMKQGIGGIQSLPYSTKS